MKRNLAIFAICASFLFLFAACGEDTMQDAANGAGGMLDEAGDMVDDAMTGAENTARSAGRDFSGNTGAVMREDGAMLNGDSYSNTNTTANSTLHGTYNNPTGTRGGSTSSYGSQRMQEEEKDPAAATTRYQLMLDNARVHDTDGFLYDGENAQNDTF